MQMENPTVFMVRECCCRDEGHLLPSECQSFIQVVAVTVSPSPSRTSSVLWLENHITPLISYCAVFVIFQYIL